MLQDANEGFLGDVLGVESISSDQAEGAEQAFVVGGSELLERCDTLKVERMILRRRFERFLLCRAWRVEPTFHGA
jgi:hypothetical protein